MLASDTARKPTPGLVLRGMGRKFCGRPTAFGAAVGRGARQQAMMLAKAEQDTYRNGISIESDNPSTKAFAEQLKKQFNFTDDQAIQAAERRRRTTPISYGSTEVG